MDSSENISTSTRRVEFSNEVQTAIDQVLPRADAPDSPDFDSVDYINQLFPNEQSLANIDEKIAELECEVSVVDDGIKNALREQTNTGEDGRISLEEAQKMVSQLLTQIINIQERAEKSEEMVQGITRDIKTLDCAKMNLTSAITTLNHLHMLVGGVDHLSKLIEKRLYADILNPLQAVIEVNKHFQQFNSIEQIKSLSQRVDDIQGELEKHINQDFHNAFSPTTKSVVKVPLSQLTDGCKIISVLDSKVRRDLLKWFVAIQLEEYLQCFHETQDLAWLDKIDKRYGWLKKHLLEFEKKFGAIFPVDWDVSGRIAEQFCIVTRDELAKVMTKRRSEIDVKLLLFAIAKSQSFEELLTKRFPEHDNKFADIITVCFKPYLDIYTDSIDKSLSDLTERLAQSIKEPFNSVEAKTTVFPSSGDLFLFFKKCLVQCNQLSNEKPLFDLAMIFKKHLREYAKILDNATPKLSNVQSTSMSLLSAGQALHNFLREGDVQLFSADELKQICCVLMTAEYCFETVEQLESKLKEKCHSSFVGRIDLSSEKDIFHRIMSNSVHHLVHDLENGCEPAFSIMAKLQWQSVKNVGDQSEYVTSIISHWKRTIPAIRDSLTASRKYFTQFCHKFVNSFIPKFINALLKCRLTSTDGAINIIGCEQLLLDTHSLKMALLDLPSIGSVVNRKPPTTFTNVVAKGMTRAEMIIKVVMTPISSGPSFNSQLLKLLPDINITDYQKMLDMKGVKRADQLQLVELLKSTSAESKSGDPNYLDRGEGLEDVPTSSSGSSFSIDRGHIRKLESLIKKRLS